MAKRFQVDTGGTLLTSLISGYRLEDATDYYSTNNLTNTGTVTFTAAKVNNGATYGTSNSTKYLSINSALGVDGGAFSVSLWVKILTAPGNGVNNYMIFQGNNTSKTEYHIDYIGTGGTPSLNFVRTRRNVADDTLSTSNDLGTSAFKHLVLTYDGSTIEGWLNGSSLGTASSSGSGSGATSNKFGIGLDLRGTPGAMASAIFDEVYVWSKKLSNQEVADLYNSGSGQTMIGGISILAIGGGAGGGGNRGGGGGAGEHHFDNNYSIGAGTYSITVGAGGAGGSSGSKGTDGSSSVIDAVTAIGGGGGGNNSANKNGRDGASGGGGGHNSNGVGGTGTAGNNGGNNDGGNSAGGGGGSGTAGANSSGNNGGNGGDGTENTITGTPTTRAAGGGGGGYNNNGGTGGSSSVGGTGASRNGQVAATNGAANTGSGGGGGTEGDGPDIYTGGNGSAGLVAIRYTTADFGTCSGGDTVTVIGSDTLRVFTSSGTLVLGSLNTTTTKTQTGVAKITVHTTKTQTGKADIKATATKTQTGKADIRVTTTKTQTGKADIKVTTTKTQTGKADIRVTTTKTQTGKADIKNTTSKTQTGKSDIRATTTKTQTGKGSIAIVTSKLQTGKSDIRVTTQRTITGTSHLIAQVDVNSEVNVSDYKWLSDSLKAAQQRFAVRPYYTCKIIDDTIVPDSILTAPNQPTNGEVEQAPDGSIWAIGGDSGGNLGVWKITDGTVQAQWAAAPNVTLATAGNWRNDLNAGISISEYINGSYTIDIYYWKNVASTIEIIHKRSTNNGVSFGTGFTMSSTGISTVTTDNVYLAAGKPVWRGNSTGTDGIVFWLRNTGTAQYVVDYAYYPGTGSTFGANTQMSMQNGNSNDWVMHSLDAYYDFENDNYTIVFSGYHNVLESTNHNFSLYLVKLLKRTNLTTTDLWSYPTEVITTLSASTQNLNNFTLPKLNFDGTFVWVIFRGVTVDSVKEDGTVTTKINYFSCFTKVIDRGFSYPSPFVFTDGTEFTDTNSYSFVAQGSFYFLAGSGKVWTFDNNDIVADVTDDVQIYEAHDTAGNPSSLTIKIGNQENKWFGSSPTGTGAAAVAKNKKMILAQGYYNSDGEPETAPKNTYFIDDLSQKISSTANDLIITGRDFYKNMKTLISRFTFNFTGPLNYLDTFDGTTIGNWNQKFGAWIETGNTFTPSTTAISGTEFVSVLSGTNIRNPSSLLSVIAKLPAGNNSAQQVTVYPFWKDDNNWVRLRISGSGSSGTYTFYIEYNVTGSVTVFDSGNFTYSDSSNIPIYIHQYSYTSYCFQYGDNTNFGNGLNAYYYALVLKNSTSGQLDVSGIVPDAPTTVAIGCTGFNSVFRSFKLAQFDNSQNIKELVEKLATKARIQDFKFQNNVEDYLFDPVIQYTGTFTAANRQLTVAAGNNAIQNVTQIPDGEVEFDALITPTDSSQNYGLDFLFRNQGFADKSQGYTFRVEKRTDVTAAIHYSAKFLIRDTGTHDGFPLHNPALIQSSAAEEASVPDIRFNNLNLDLTKYNHYKIVFVKGWFYGYVNGVMVVAWQDNNNGITFSTGYFGFSANTNTTIKVKNVIATNFYQQIAQLTVNPGDDFETSAMNVMNIVRGWKFSDLFGRLKAVLLGSSDPSTYTYDSIIVNQGVDNSDKEFVNQVTVIGQGVSAIARDNESIGSNAIVRDQVIVDYKITSLADAQSRANFELTNFNKFNIQPSPKTLNNVGSEIFDAITIVNTGDNSSDIDQIVRNYNQQQRLDGTTNEDSITLGAGEL